MKKGQKKRGEPEQEKTGLEQKIPGTGPKSLVPGIFCFTPTVRAASAFLSAETVGQILRLPIRPQSSRRACGKRP